MIIVIPFPVATLLVLLVVFFVGFFAVFVVFLTVFAVFGFLVAVLVVFLVAGFLVVFLVVFIIFPFCVFLTLSTSCGWSRHNTPKGVFLFLVVSKNLLVNICIFYKSVILDILNIQIIFV